MKQRLFILAVLSVSTFLGCTNSGGEDPSQNADDIGYASLKSQAETLFETFKPARCPVDSTILLVKDCTILVERTSASTVTVRQIASVVAREFENVGASFLVICNYQLDGSGFTWISGTTTASVLGSAEGPTIVPLENGLSEDGGRLCPSTFQ